MPYQYLFFDLDHTLWDYDTSAKQTLTDLYSRYELDTYGANGSDELIRNFFRVNDSLWSLYNKGEISKYYLRTERFPKVLESSGVNMVRCPQAVISGFNEDYLAESPKKGNLIPEAIETLEALRSEYDLYLITNGFEEIQTTKLQYSGLDKYFRTMITSEKAGAKKPFPEIFKYALNHTGAALHESIMIGDNLQTDIQGARDFGMDQVFFNPHRMGHTEDVTHEITRLSELIPLLS